MKLVTGMVLLPVIPVIILNPLGGPALMQDLRPRPAVTRQTR